MDERGKLEQRNIRTTIGNALFYGTLAILFCILCGTLICLLIMAFPVHPYAASGVALFCVLTFLWIYLTW